MSAIGRSVRRLEDPPLLRGEGRFAADVAVPGMVAMRVVRSPVAHGVLRGIDASTALALPGVIAVWTAADVADLPPIDFRMTRVEGLGPYRQPVLAPERVRYVGEPVAVVFATDTYLAEDAADLVALDLEPLPAVLDLAGDPVLWSGTLGNEPAVIRKGYGDVEAAFRAATHVVELDLAIARHSAVPMETRGALAVHDRARDILELHGAAKVPHYNRDALAAMLGRPPSRLHLVEGHVGGGFGVRGELYPEDVLVALAALRLRRPVRWIEDRREHLMAANQSRGQSHCIRAAVDADGVVLAIDDRFVLDQGAYVRTHGATVADLSAAMLPGPYRIPAYRAEGHIRLTNRTPCGTYRAPGRYETTFVRERLMDAVADRLGLDRIEVRRRNLIGAAEMPYARPIDTLGTPVTYDSGDYASLLDRALETAGWPAMRAAASRRRAAGEQVGLGLALFVEKSGLGPFDGVTVTVDTTGAVEVVTGAASVGQGVETVMAQVCADALGVAVEAIRVVHGQTERIAYGMGAFASRVTAMTGAAVHAAGLSLRAKALTVAAELLQTPAERLTIVAGRVHRQDAPGGPSIGLGEIARALSPASPLRGDHTPGLSAEGWHYASHMSYPYGVHIAQVSVDPETGGVAVERYIVAYDIGRAVNPMLVEGQIHGGAAQGLGGALYEAFLYDDAGQPLAVTFADYLIPTAAEVPTFEVLITEDAPAPENPLGVKGAGEGGTNAAGAAIAAAIDDALGRPGAVTAVPVTPPMIRAIVRANGEAL